MHISRVQIEEGFLDGLDVKMRPGLNVVIGARGTGKTSLIELIRFCLGAPSSSQEYVRRSREHALSVLGSGEVIVTLASKEGEREVHVSRSADDTAPRSDTDYAFPIVFSQTEIENIGLSAQGRLQLIDAFNMPTRWAAAGQSKIAEIRSLTAEMSKEVQQADRVTEEVQQIEHVLRRLRELAPQESRLATLSADAKEKKNRLDQLSEAIAKNSVTQDHIDRFLAMVQTFAHDVDGIANNGSRTDGWEPALGVDPLKTERSAVNEIAVTMRNQVAKLSNIFGSAKEKLDAVRKDRVEIEVKARVLRSEIEGLEKGAGAIARDVQNLRQRLAQLEDMARVLESRRFHLSQLAQKRKQAMEDLESIRDARFRQREAIVKDLNLKLGPRIRISIERAGQFEQFASTIADALKGSGIRYSDLAPLLAQTVSPRELVEAVDEDNVESIVVASGISIDRALRALSALKYADLGAVATVEIEDDIRLELLDGPHYKDISELSTGQRCTVTLPIVLSHRDRIVIVDQPEDHIDNAFITDTLIKSISSRGRSGQMIFSTHNANIPVLGSAETVIQMASDGRRGFAAIAAPLQNPTVVDAISKVMEGGRDAFRRRAEFYGEGDIFG